MFKAFESGSRRPAVSPLVVAADGVEAEADDLTKNPRHVSTSAVLSVSIDASCCVDVADSDDELVPYAESSTTVTRREQRAQERRTADKSTVAVSDRVAYPPHALALGTVDAASTLRANRASEAEATGVLPKSMPLIRIRAMRPGRASLSNIRRALHDSI